MSVLNKHQIIAAIDRKYVEVNVREWGGKVRLQSLDADQMLAYEELLAKRQAGEKSAASPLVRLLVDSIVDAEGKPVFGEEDMKDLGKKAPGILGRLVKEASKLNKIDESELQGNSEAAPSGG